ncbi:MAG: glycosyltransferase [Candidatus Nomurabacteria bacterium]|jgi:glycosyltransferase involved in cell wall biosynthesis|nr:glycosyltransferase [Candidatus Nomurabacteria bacterium]
MIQKIAIVCDWLTEGFGGAERVIAAVAKMYPNAPIYTSQYRPSKTDWLPTTDVRVGWLNRLPVWSRRLIPFLRAYYFSHLDLSSYDVVISISGAEAKYVKTGAKTKHISYIHAPTQYYWGKYDEYYKNPGFGILNPLVRLGLKILISPLKRADFRYTQRPDILLANSTFVQNEIKKYYKRRSVVVFPPVKVAKSSPPTKQRAGFVSIGRLASWKRFDLSVAAVKKTGDKLLIVGGGPSRQALQKAAKGQRNIKFKPPIHSVRKISQILSSADGFIFTSQEPFGIAPVEALMSGVPVIAYRNGGALDFIIDGKNGLFFKHQTVESLVEAIEKFHTTKFNPSFIKKSAAKFSEANFKRQIRQIVGV